MGTPIRSLGKNSPLLRDLRQRIRHRREGEILLDGRRLLDDAIRWEIPIREMYLSESRVADLSSLPNIAEVRKFLLDDEVLKKLAPTRNSQGLLAFVDEPQFPVWAAEEGIGLYLERIQDPLNVGAIIRSAAALGARSVWLSPGCADPFGPRAVRASAATVFRVPIEVDVTLETAITRAGSAGCPIWATGAGGCLLDEWRPSSHLLLLLGSEGPGLSSQALEISDGILGIRLEGGVESLNVAVATGVLLARIRAILSGPKGEVG